MLLAVLCKKILDSVTFLSLCWSFPLASISKQHAALLIDLFGWYVLFSRWSSGGISPFVFFIIMLKYAREWGKIWKKQSSRVLSYDLHWENKTYKLKRCISLCTRARFLKGRLALIQEWNFVPFLYLTFTCIAQGTFCVIITVSRSNRSTLFCNLELYALRLENRAWNLA